MFNKIGSMLLIMFFLLMIIACESKAKPSIPFLITKEDNQTINSYINENLSKPNSGGEIYSVHEILGSDKEAGEIYIWTILQEVYKNGDHFKSTSGLSLPIVLHVEEGKEGLKIVNYNSPRDGSDYPKDIKKLFPKDVRNKIYKHKNEELIKEFDDKYINRNSEKKD